MIRKMKKTKEKDSWKGTLMYIIVGIALAFFINQGLALGLSTDMPVVAVESNSMIPTFYKGDILVLQGVGNPDEYINFLKIGDIIVFSPSGHEVPVVHRIIKINPDGTFQTLGDANNGQQLPFEKRIEPEQIHGKMIFKLPYLGWIKIGMTQLIMPNIAFVILIIIAAFILYFIFFKR